MSTDPGLAAVPSGPPWSVDVLADLQAGVYSDEVTARLRARIADDPEAMAILAALDATVDDLSLLPAPRMPERFALRLDAAIAAESAARSAGPSSAPPAPAAPSAPPTFRPGPPAAPPTFRPLTSAPPPPFAPVAPPSGAPPSGEPSKVGWLVAARTKRGRWITGSGVAAAVAAAATITVASLNNTTGGSGSSQADGGGAPAATASASPNALELTPGDFQSAYSKINGASTGPLTNPINYAGCMSANNVAQADVLGVKQVTYQGKNASAIAIKVDAAHAKILVVSLQCGVDGGADVLASETVNR